MPRNKSIAGTHAGAQMFCDIVRPLLIPKSPQSILVAGCGNGSEALHIRVDLDVQVTGVDVNLAAEGGVGADLDRFELLQGSVLDLPYPDNSFDFVFYHHVIEHVTDPAKSLDELARVLMPDGLIYVGTPNRHRVVGYIGSHTATTYQKLKWNAADYRARLRNRFRNEFGAHAGFSEKELSALLSRRFVDIQFVTSDYLRFKYGDRLPRPVMDALCAQPFLEVAAPSIYAVARKSQ